MKATDKFFDYYDLKQGYTPDEPEGVNRSYEWSVYNELVLNFKIDGLVYFNSSEYSGFHENH